MSPPEYSTLLKTKISIPPSRPEVVSRKRLLSQLAEGMARPLTLICATAGFGKTTVLTDWIHTSADRTRVGWLSLDKDDNDPMRFMSYFSAALEIVEPGMGRVPLSLLGSLKTPTPKGLMMQLLNEIAVLPGSLVLVLDDYHVIEDPDIDAALTYVVDHAPEQLRLVIATRTEPRLPLARWRTQERITEIGMDDLRFSYEEAAQFLNHTMGLELDTESMRTLDDRTEGWIAGLQMAALSMQGHARAEGANHIAEVAKAFGGEHRYVIDYLAAEVLRQQPAEVRTFLHQTAIPDRLCASLCDAVTERTDGKALLSHIEQANLFLVRLDDRREWYRYHQLFADFLRAELPESEQAALHRKASTWYEAHGLAPEAVKHALATQDIPTAVRLIRAHADEILCRGEFPTMLAWLEALPESTVLASSDLCGFKAWLLYMRGRIDEAEAYPALAHSGEGSDASPLQSATLLAFRAFLALNRGDPKQAVPLAQKALDQLGDTQSFFRTCALSLLGHAQRFSGDRKSAIETLQRTVKLGQKLGNHLITLDALGSLALLMHTQGQLREAMLLCQQAVDRYMDARGKPLPAAGLVYVPLGVLYYEINELESARNCLTTGIALCQKLGMVYYTLLGQRSLARVQHARGEREAAWTALAAARQLTERAETPRRRRLVDAVTAELQLHEGNLAAAARTLGETRSVADSTFEFERLAYARLFIAQGEPRMAESVLSPLEETARNENQVGRLIAVQVLQALCKRAQGNRVAALEILERALSLAATPGYRRTFLDEGPAVSALLGQLRHVAPAFVNSLLEAFPHVQAAAPAAATLPAPLSKTQLEILRLLDFGLSNQEIAAKLRITVGTTKWHMNQMFGKLQAHSRTDVLAKGRQLGLL